MKRMEIAVINPKDEQQALLAWAARVDAGEEMAEAGPRLSFATYGQLHATLTEERMAALDLVTQHEGSNIRQLAAMLDRDYENVHADIQIFSTIGLIAKCKGGLFAPDDEINIHKTLRKAA